MTDLTCSQYCEEIEALAVEIVSEIEDGRDSSECVHETVDGHHWIIYSAYHDDVMSCSDYPEAHQDIYCNEMLGEIVKEKGLDHVKMIQAFYAMDYDLGQKVHDLAKEKLEELEEKRDRLESLIEKKEARVESIERQIEDLDEDIEQVHPSLERFRVDYENNIELINKHIEVFQDELEAIEEKISNLEDC